MVTASWMRCARILLQRLSPSFCYCQRGSGDLRKAMELGADDYRPCTLKELLASITAVWKNRPSSGSAWRLTPKSPRGVTYWYCKPGGPGRSFLLQMNDVFRFIEANYHPTDWPLRRGSNIGYSRHLTNLVRQQTGQSVHRWIVKRRMAEARSFP